MRKPNLRAFRRKAHRLARRTASVRYRSIVVPLLGRSETEHALDLACRLAADSGARVVLVAPLVVPQELPLDAHFDAETEALRGALAHASAIAESYGVTATRRIVRTRERALGRELAEVARDHRAELIVLGAPVESRLGFRRAFPLEVLSILRDAPCRVMIATGPFAGRRTTVTAWPGGAASSRTSSASSARTPSLQPRTATSALRSTTRSASPRSSPSG
ncbi:MAG TPA: universal stress protein [Gaiellaceae bacterium]|nr:universal stress protein [Gaiellaceae bacterium]